MNKRVGLIGIGLMGGPMGENWIKKGYGLNFLAHKNRAPAEKLKSVGAIEVETLQQLADQSDVIVLMVPTSREVEALCLGSNGLERWLSPKQVVIDMSTSDPESTRRIHQIYKKSNLRFMDAPVTGGVSGAALGTLTLFVGGPVDWHHEVKEVLAAVSKTQSHFGEAGNGHVAKIINNFICVGNLAVFCEALPLAVKLGLEPSKIYDTLLSGTASSEMLKFYGPQILAGDFAPRFKLAHASKDIDLAVSQANAVHTELPVLNGVQSLFHKALEAGKGERNLSSVIELIESQLGIEFRKKT
jgi:3-hydroxyisobutyrate dehydrogenase-like beta-hydroxyacid dehydrogenase